MSPALTAAELHHYREHGWVVAPQFLRRRMGADPDTLRQHFMELHERIPHDQRFGGVEDEHEDTNHQYPRLINMHGNDELTACLASNPALLDAVAALLDDEPLLNQTMLYFKPPRGRGQALHQDMAIITIDPLLGVWAPLDQATTEVGPMIVVDKSHHDGFAVKRDADMSLSFTEGEAVPAQGREAIELELDQGDVLFFDGRTIHGSGKNMTQDQWRRTFICHFVGKHSERLTPPSAPNGRALVTSVTGPPGGGKYEDWNVALQETGGLFLNSSGELHKPKL